MTRLIVAELKRLVWRRMTWVMVASLAAVGLAVAAAALYAFSTNQPGIPSPDEMRATLRVGMEACAIVTSLAALMLGATFVGAEIATGSLSQWLTFSPNRHKVYASKLLVALFGGLVLGLVACLGYHAVAQLVGLQLGWPTVGPDAPVLLRSTLLVGLACVTGAALAALFSHTAAAPVALGAYIVFLVIRSMFGSYADLLVRASLELHVHGFVWGTFSYPADYDEITYEAIWATIPLWESVAYVLGIVATVVALGWWRLVRRDHT